MDTSTLFELFKVYRDVQSMGIEQALLESRTWFPIDVDPEFDILRATIIDSIEKLNTYFKCHLRLDGTELGSEIYEKFKEAGYDWEDIIYSDETISTDGSDEGSSMDDFIDDDTDAETSSDSETDSDSDSDMSDSDSDF